MFCTQYYNGLCARSVWRRQSENQIGEARKQKTTEPSKQPVTTGYFGHVIGYQPIIDQYFLGSVGSCQKGHIYTR